MIMFALSCFWKTKPLPPRSPDCFQSPFVSIVYVSKLSESRQWCYLTCEVYTLVSFSIKLLGLLLLFVVCSNPIGTVLRLAQLLVICPTDVESTAMPFLSNLTAVKHISCVMHSYSMTCVGTCWSTGYKRVLTGVCDRPCVCHRKEGNWRLISKTLLKHWCLNIPEIAATKASPFCVHTSHTSRPSPVSCVSPFSETKWNPSCLWHLQIPVMISSKHTLVVHMTDD